MIGRYLAGAAGVGLIAFALWLGINAFGKAKYAEGRMSIALDISAKSLEAERDNLAAYQKGIAQGQAATKTFIEWREGPLRTQKEIVYRDTQAFAQSADGARICFDALGVSGVNQDIARANATAFTGAAVSGATAVRAIPEPTAEQR